MKTLFITFALLLGLKAFAFDNTLNVECANYAGVFKINMDNPAGSSNVLGADSVRLVSFKDIFGNPEISFGHLKARQLYLEIVDDSHYGYGYAVSARFVDENAETVLHLDAAKKEITFMGETSVGLCLLPTGE